MNSSPDYNIIYPEEDIHSQEGNFARDIYNGLRTSPRFIPSQYHYDDEGSRLFQEIMGLEEYYVTDCEEEILENYPSEIIKNTPDTFYLIDFGSGDGKKSLHILREAFKEGKEVTFVPVDISSYAVELLTGYVKNQFPGVPVQGLAMTYEQAFTWMEKHLKGAKLALVLGGNIGNFPKTQAKDFLQSFLRFMEKKDQLLIGFDLKKTPDIIHAAYNDKEGITSAFNLNLLKRINRELGGNISIDNFKHFAAYNPDTGIVNSYLVSTTQQEITIPEANLTFSMAPWETIHTEFSVKYSIEEIQTLAQEAGFTSKISYTDRHSFFTDTIWQR